MNVPLITVIDRNFALQAQIDIYTSFLLNRKWQSVGDWQLVLPASAKGADKLKKGNIILLGSDGHRSGYIEGITANEGDNGTVLTVTGKTLQGLALQRITLPDNDEYNYGYDNVPKLTGEDISPAAVPAETVLKTYAKRHLAEPEDPKRKFSALEIAEDLKRGNETLWSSRIETLSDVLSKISEY
ncbi:MAG: siphovirus ReqiPepy6 Gp37-like family protein [Ruminiclostridium sp.]|nr:siphovirus ReqiPepy6 Gp37-like family protein [Ruminiclostridium sp.]